MSAIPLRTLAFGLGLALVVTAGPSDVSAAPRLWSPTAQDSGASALKLQVNDWKFHGKRHYWQHRSHRKLVPHHKLWRQYAKRHRWQHHYRPLLPFAWQRHHRYHRPHFFVRPPHHKYWNFHGSRGHGGHFRF